MQTTLTYAHKNIQLCSDSVTSDFEGCVEFNISIYPVKDNGELLDSIGVCRFSIYDLPLCCDKSKSLFLSSLTKDFKCIIEASCRNFTSLKSIAIVDSLTIDCEFRGNGFGSTTLEALILYFSTLNIDGVALVSGWSSKDNSKLDSFYISNGFSPIGKYNDASIVFKSIANQ